MESNRLITVFLFCSMVCFSHFHGAGLAEEKAAEDNAPETIKAGLRATCDGLPVRNLSATITLVNPHNGKEYKGKRHYEIRSTEFEEGR